MKYVRPFLIILALAGGWQPLEAAADPSGIRSPFGVAVSTSAWNGAAALKIDFTIPTNCVLYAERLHFLSPDGEEIVPSQIPPPATLLDKVTGHEKKLYDRNFSAVLKPVPGTLLVKFQGCTNDACFFPEKRAFALNKTGTYEEMSEVPVNPANLSAAAPTWESLVKDFHITGRQTGYIKAGEFLSFLDLASSGQAPAEEDPLVKFKKLGVAATLCLIVLGGLGLNLTPCVLPLIPINLAIIGAGKAARSRQQGFIQGAAYGLGMALTYGILGLCIVLTGAKFGTLNSSVGFNAGIALIFSVLSLAMFDVFHIDFSKYDWLAGRSPRRGNPAARTLGNWLMAFSLGSVAALLAGACVAPVVISVILMATDMHAKGVELGLALPFLLGLGMALPWPFMGASLSLLPKPGKWMVWVKYTFGVAIILFAFYYGHLAYGLVRTQHRQTSLAAAPAAAAGNADSDQLLVNALAESRRTGRPVFVDFAASWCKNCEAMDATVFNQEKVKRRLKDFIAVRYSAERPNDSPAREVLNHFNILGLPTYLVLSAKEPLQLTQTSNPNP